MLLAEPRNSVSWSTLGKLFKRLLRTKLMDAEDLSDQCIRTFFRQAWPLVSARDNKFQRNHNKERYMYGTYIIFYRCSIISAGRDAVSLKVPERGH